MYCQKKPLIFDWTVLEDQEELEAVLWTRFRVVFLGSEIVWKLSESVSCSRTNGRGEEAWFQKRWFPCFFKATKVGWMMIGTHGMKKTRLASYGERERLTESWEHTSKENKCFIRKQKYSALTWQQKNNHTNSENGFERRYSPVF